MKEEEIRNTERYGDCNEVNYDLLFEDINKLQKENKQLKDKLRIDIQMTADLEVVRNAIKQKADFKEMLEELIFLTRSVKINITGIEKIEKYIKELIKNLEEK